MALDNKIVCFYNEKLKLHIFLEKKTKFSSKNSFKLRYNMPYPFPKSGVPILN